MQTRRLDAYSYLEEKALEYRRKANSIDQPQVVAQLLAMALSLEERLAILRYDLRLERRFRGSSSPPSRFPK